MSDNATFLIAKGTLLLLLVASALTWALAIVKGLQKWRIAREDQAFAKAFASSSGPVSAEELAQYTGPLARVARAGAAAWRESAEEVGEPAALDIRTDLLERSLRQQLQRERRLVEGGLPVLASIGSTAPFVGLFGTVMGIIHALTRISGAGSASLEVVAGPIGEALVATGIGIAVAIPAVLFYNYFVRGLKGFVSQGEDFASTFVASAVKRTLRDAGQRRRQSEPRAILSQEARA